MAKPILLVEDDQNDVLFMQMALESAGIDAPLEIAPDGQRALDYLREALRPAEKGQPPPSVMICDLRLPRVPGDELLKWVRQQPAYVNLPVIVLTSSNAETDVERAYRHGASSYIIKPANPVELNKIAALIRDYWVHGEKPPGAVDQYTQPMPSEALSTEGVQVVT